MPSSSSAPALAQRLGLVSATAIVMGSMIGSGIFLVSAEIAREVNSAALLLLVWLITGLMSMAAALCYGELAAAMPAAGGQYVYLREALGPIFGYLYGWTDFWAIQTGAIAAVAMALAIFLGNIFPSVSSSHWLFHWGDWGPLHFGVNTVELAAIACIALLTWSNTRGVRTGAWIQNVFTALKVLALAAIIAIGLFLIRVPAAVHANFAHFWSGIRWTEPHLLQLGDRHFMVTTLTLIFVAMIGSLFSSDAWNTVTFTAGETRSPQRNIPLSLILGTGIVTALYLLANLAYLNVLPLAGHANALTTSARGIQHATEDRVATAMISVLLGHHGVVVMAAAIVISCFGCMNGQIMGGARVYYAMAKDGVFFRRMARLHPERRVPTFALVAQGVWASLLCLSGTYTQLLEFVMFPIFLFYILTVAGLFALRWKRPDMPRPYRALGYPVLPALYILAAAWFDFQILRFEPVYAGAGLTLVLIGLPVFLAWRRPRRPVAIELPIVK
ncbi:MAG: amino acid permease [Acidobacteria bacterium]|nr:MAG: amino acid permease [Acidobacteriota bacterium]